MNMAEKIILACDVDTINQAYQLCNDVGEELRFIKIGMQLQLDITSQSLYDFKQRNLKIFLDYKYLDIPNTVHNAVKRACDCGVDFLTVHATPTVLDAAAKASESYNTQILAVTVLTSSNDDDLKREGFSQTTQEMVKKRAGFAHDANIDGVIASVGDIAMIKNNYPNLLVVTPGIRLNDSDKGDQKRVATPQQAIKNGADYMVIGRSITNHPTLSPKDAFHLILNQL